MKKALFAIGILLSVLSAQSQDFIGQWYGADYHEFLEITEDSVFFITLWGEEFGTPECYEVEAYPYELDNGQIWVESSAMNFNMICIMANANDSMYVEWPGFGYPPSGYSDTVFSLASMVDCSHYYTWACDGDACFETSDDSAEYLAEDWCEYYCDSSPIGYDCSEDACVESEDEVFGGAYATLEECEKMCGVTTFSCNDGACVDVGAFGSYATLEECELACESGAMEYVCVAGSCIEVAAGSYETLEECEKFCGTTSVAENKSTIYISLNPFSDYTILEFTNNPMHYKVFDVNGRLVRTEKITTNRMQFSRGDLPSGIYYLEVIGDEAVIREKLLVE